MLKGSKYHPISFTAEDLQSAAASLKPEHVAVLAASLTGGYAKTAADLGIKIGTVKSRLSRARAALEAVLAKNGAI